MASLSPSSQLSAAASSTISSGWFTRTEGAIRASPLRLLVASLIDAFIRRVRVKIAESPSVCVVGTQVQPKLQKKLDAMLSEQVVMATAFEAWLKDKQEKIEEQVREEVSVSHVRLFCRFELWTLTKGSNSGCRLALAQ